MNAILGNFRKVEQMKGRSGPIKNQFLIYTDKGTVFQSHDTVIAAKMIDGVVLDKSWDCSRTTGKYRNHFLGESKADTERNIKEGRYKVMDLN